jgi:ferrous iron transport protein B
LEEKGSRKGVVETETEKAAERYLQWRREVNGVALERKQATLNRTVAGWLGRSLEYVTSPLGFDYRINIALVGGFAAKEIVVSTLGTAYSLGDVDPNASGSLSDRLRDDPHWNPLLAFTLLIFTMLYVPCFATVISISKESSWRWAMFSIVFNLFAAYLVALLITQVGRFLGIGL